MGLQSIDKVMLIERKNLNSNQYTVSLLKEAFRTGLIDKGTIDNIQAQIMFILKDLIMRYTKGESTSVTVETAEKILNSIYYSIDAYTESLHNPEDGIALLKTKKMKEIYEKGFELIKSCVSETKMLYERILKNKLNVPLEEYNLTIDEAFPDFFRKYGMVFDAHDTMASIDYPLVFDDMNIRGIFYIKHYLENLETETEFCKLYTKEDIIKVLANYGRIYSIDYRTSLINLFEILINNSIFSVMSGNNGDTLTISKPQYDFLNSKLSSSSPNEINSLFDEATEKIIKGCCIKQPKLIDYIRKYKAILLVRVLSAVENGSLHNLILTDEEKLQNSDIIFEEGNRMDDDSFCIVVDKIMECESTEEKINIITSSISSSEDFIDVLKGDCLFGDEFSAAFSTLSDMELSLLGGIVLSEELRNGPLDLSPAIIGEMEIEVEWQQQYIKFIQTLSKDRIKLIERLINVIG